jgi:hypothetical protein
MKGSSGMCAIAKQAPLPEKHPLQPIHRGNSSLETMPKKPRSLRPLYTFRFVSATCCRPGYAAINNRRAKVDLKWLFKHLCCKVVIHECTHIPTSFIRPPMSHGAPPSGSISSDSVATRGNRFSKHVIHRPSRSEGARRLDHSGSRKI